MTSVNEENSTWDTVSKKGKCVNNLTPIIRLASRFEMLRYSVPDAMCLCLEVAHSSLIVFLPLAFLFAPCSQQKKCTA
jgi:hypothetical protein